MKKWGGRVNQNEWKNVLPARKAAFVLLAFAALLIVAVWSVALVEVASERRRAEDDAFKDAETFARAYEEHTARTIAAADQSARFLQYQYEHRGTHFDMNEYLSAGALATDIFNLFTIVNANGDVVASSKPFASVNLSDRQHIRVHMQNASDKLFLSQPVMGRVSKKWSMQLTRRLNTRSGEFDGVVVVSLDPFYFSRVYRDFTASRNGLVSLVGADGIIRARQVGTEAFVGQDLSGSPTFHRILETSNGKLRASSAIDGTERYLAYRKLEGFPLYVVVGLSIEDVMSGVEEYKRSVHNMAWLTTVLVVLFTGLLLRTITRIEASRQEAIRANAAKSQFLANMSHELRTPLNGILGYSELLSMEVINAEHLKFANAIYASGNHLLALVNAVLDIEKVASGKMEAHYTNENLAALLQEVTDGHRSNAMGRGLNLELTIDASLPSIVACDRVKLVQVLNNLIHNAVKFTDAGYVRIHATLRQEGGRGMVAIEVSDSGPGIPPNLHQSIFEKFVQVDDSDSRAHQGTGLGLALAKELATLMSGRIDLKSTPPNGATFTLLLPHQVSTS